MKLILATPSAGATCADAALIMLTVNASTYISIPLIK